VIRRRFLAVTLATAAIGLGGCDKLFGPAKSPFTGVDVTGSPMGGELRLTDHEGRPRSLADFRGKAVVVVFGFTHCPDVCPTALSDMARAVRELGERGQDVQVLFVTLDPARDSAELLKQYVPAFHPAFLGLRGSEAETTAVTKDFKVYSNQRPGKTPDSYTIDHSAQNFVFDREGRIRLLLPPNMASAAIASDLRLILNS
jgi:protein SCO1